MARRKKRSRKSLFGALALLLLLSAMLPLGSFLAGFLSGGGRLDDPDARDPESPRPASLRITVLRASDHSPVVGATISVTGLAGGEAEAVTDDRGHATFKDLPRGPVRVVAMIGNERAVAWADPRRERDLLLAVAPKRQRRGRVLTAKGEGVPARVHLLDRDGKELDAARTDAEGRYELTDDPDAHCVCADPDDAAPGVATSGDIVIHAGEWRRGRLLGIGGAGDLMVYGQLHAPDDDAMFAFRARWRVAADGRFSGRLPPGVKAWGVFGGRPFEIRDGDIEMPREVTAKGRVRRADGEGAAKAVLWFRPLLGADFPLPLPGIGVEASDTGHFEQAGFADIRYAVHVRASGCATRLVTDVAPGAGAIELRLEPGYDIGGFVMDAQGLPIPYALVLAVSLPPRSDWPVARDRADDRGAFLVTGLGGEHASVRVAAPGYHPTTLDPVRATDQLRVTLQKR